MQPTTFSTAGIERKKQLSAWRNWFDTLCEADAGNPDEGFLATSETWDFGGFGMSRIRAPKLRVMRTPELIRRTPFDHWHIVVGNARTIGHSGNRTLDVPAGQPFALTFGKPFLSARESDERVQLFLPRDASPELDAALEKAEGLPISGPMGRLLADFMMSLARTASDLTDAQWSNLKPAVSGLLLACMAQSAEWEADPMLSAPLAVMRMRAVRKLVDAHLRNPNLGADFICHSVGMSRSQLYRLLECEGGVMQFVQRRRLMRCHAELSDGGDMPITAIAACYGFSDPSSFSRSFRREFGVTPLEVQEAAMLGQPVIRRSFDTATMRDVLRAMQPA